MARQYQWVLDPDSGGNKIPERLKAELKKKIEALAEKDFKGKYERMDIRFRGQFCYIGTLHEPQIPDDFPSSRLGTTREEYLDRLRNTPRPLCVYDILVTIAGALVFTLIAMKNTNCAFLMRVVFSGKPKMPFCKLRDFICIEEVRTLVYHFHQN
jgi:hypothetical protein